MRLHVMLHALGRLRRSVDGELTSRLLVAAMLVPLVEALFGWRPHTPLDVPLAVHMAILIALLVLSPSPIPHAPRDTLVPRGVLWLPVPLVAMVLAVVLNARSNVFYTGRTLMDGMSLLVAIHFVGIWLRRRAAVRHEVGLVRPATAHVGRLPRWWRSRGPTVVAPRSPAVRLADALTTIVGWSLLVSWILIAFEHRHVVGPILILAGVLESIALVVLIPDALPRALWAVWSPDDDALRRHPDQLGVVRGGAPSRDRVFGLRLRRRAKQTRAT